MLSSGDASQLFLVESSESGLLRRIESCFLEFAGECEWFQRMSSIALGSILWHPASLRLGTCEFFSFCSWTKTSRSIYCILAYKKSIPQKKHSKNGCMHTLEVKNGKRRTFTCMHACTTAIVALIASYLLLLVKVKSVNESSDFSGFPELLQETSDELLLKTSKNLSTKRRRELLEKIKDERIKEYLDQKKRR